MLIILLITLTYLIMFPFVNIIEFYLECFDIKYFKSLDKSDALEKVHKAALFEM